MFNREEVDEIVIAQVLCNVMIWIDRTLWNLQVFLKSVVFLLAGFDTTATTLTSAIFLLARNPEVQQKLYDGIQRKLETFVSQISPNVGN